MSDIRERPRIWRLWCDGCDDERRERFDTLDAEREAAVERFKAHDGHRVEEVVRCASCHAPRCGHVHDPDPCMERRHHDGLHLFLSGSYEPVGGYLAGWQ